TCIALRHAHPALRSGEFKVLQAQGGKVVYLRQLGQDVAVVVLNRASQTLHLDVPVENTLPEGSVWRNALGAGTAQVTHGHLHGLTLSPLSGAVLLPA
ncbi:alpha-glucosidase C-terminal domain-containing protein, partial [Thermanaerothrix sp.]